MYCYGNDTTQRPTRVRETLDFDYKLKCMRSSSLLSFVPSSNKSGFSLSLSRDFLRLDFVVEATSVSELTCTLSPERNAQINISFHNNLGLCVLYG